MSRLGDVQGTFEVIPAHNQPVQVGARNALARALRPDFVGIIPEDFLTVTDEHLELASPELLRPSLIDVKKGSPGAVSYYDPDKKEATFVAVTPYEHGLINGSIQALGARAVAGSLHKRQRPGVRNPVDDAAAVRAGIHAVSNRATETQKYLHNHLEEQMRLVSRFQEAAKYPGLARFGNEANMRASLAYLRTYVFGSMLTTIGNQREWNSNQQTRAYKAFDARIFLDRQNNNHIENFKAALDLAQEWNGYKKAIIATRLWQAKKYIHTHEPNAQLPQ